MLLSLAILTPIRAMAEAKVARASFTLMTGSTVDSDICMALLDFISHGYKQYHSNFGGGQLAARCYYFGKPGQFAK